jgi:penicillin-binding protein 1A
MATAFSPFANGGSGVVPHVVKRILTRDGTVLYERHGNGIGRVIPQSELGPMNYMMREVVLSGTGKSAAIAGEDIAGKTGTSQDYRDAWFIGYSAYYVCAVWAGNDDNSATNKVTGGTLPAAVFREIMTPAHRNLAYAALPGFYAPGSYGGPDGMAGTNVPGETSVNIAEPQAPARNGNVGGGIIMNVLRNIFGGVSELAPPPPVFIVPEGAGEAPAAPVQGAPLAPLVPSQPVVPWPPEQPPPANLSAPPKGEDALLEKLQRKLNAQP